MSNLSRLEAVSDALDTAINTANSLPNAGSGGGSVETCTATIYLYDVQRHEVDSDSVTVVYTNSSSNIVNAFPTEFHLELTISGYDCFASLTVQKNTLLYINIGANSASGEIEWMDSYTYKITGDCTIFGPF